MTPIFAAGLRLAALAVTSLLASPVLSHGRNYFDPVNTLLLF